MDNAISWFEIPAVDLSRAQSFYETIFGATFFVMEVDNQKMCMFPIDDPMKGVGGAIVESSEFSKPAAEGPLIYLNGGSDLQNVLGKVAEAGGTVVLEKTSITPEYGFMAVFMDTEGNRIGLHSMS